MPSTAIPAYPQFNGSQPGLGQGAPIKAGQAGWTHAPIGNNVSATPLHFQGRGPGKDTVSLKAKGGAQSSSSSSTTSSATSSATLIGNLPQQVAAQTTPGLFATIKHWGMRAVQALFAIFTLDFVFKLFTGR